MKDWKSTSIKDYYLMALAEGEGVGTAYEYCAKEQKLAPLLQAVDPNGAILIAGLPERYGFSLDFVSLAAKTKASLTILDDRQEKLDRIAGLIESLPPVFQPPKTQCSKLSAITSLDGYKLEKFDLALSCEVLQKLPGMKRREFVANLGHIARHVGIFAPNGENPEHAHRSGLDTLGLKELLVMADTNLQIVEAGYLDMPPFPPGLKRNQEQRTQVLASFTQRSALLCLEKWRIFEELLPNFIKRKFCHITYAFFGT